MPRHIYFNVKSFNATIVTYLFCSLHWNKIHTCFLKGYYMVVHLDTQPLLYSGLGNEHYRKKKSNALPGKGKFSNGDTVNHLQ